MAKKLIIKCPHCGWEYLTGEIFTSEFIGKPYNIIKDENGVILGFDGTDVDLEDSYICDHCDKEFNVVANLSFKTSVVEDIFNDDFDEVESEGK